MLGGIDNEPTPDPMAAQRTAARIFVGICLVVAILVGICAVLEVNKPNPEPKRTPPVGGRDRLPLGARGVGGAVLRGVLAVSE